MNVHVLLDTTFFSTSVPIGDQQRLLPVPAGKGLHVGDVVFLRDTAGILTWVGDVLAGGETETTAAWSDVQSDEKQRHAIVGYLARIHPDALPRGSSKLAARWVTLNRRTLPGTLPWWSDHILVYHSTLRLIEGILTPEQAQQAESRGYLKKHPSGHWTIPHGEARKRILVDILEVDLICGLCGGPIAGLESATQDHIIPISQGGPDTLSNVQLAHRACNELKGNALPEQYPPFFPRPGDTAAGWYGRAARNARGGRNKRTRRGQPTPTTAAFQVETREIQAVRTSTHIGSAANEAAVGEEAAPRKTTEPAPPNGDAATKPGKQSSRTTKQAGKQANATKSAAATKSKSPTSEKTTRTNESAETTTDAEPGVSLTEDAPNVPSNPEPDKQSPAPQTPLSPEEQAWLAEVQRAGLTRLQAYAKKPQWAARTASLRTLEQLPRARAGKARAQGTLLAEASGPKGRFQLLHWENQHVLVEERGRRQTVHLVQMSAAVTPEAYVSYLTRFGRTSPLAVIMALLPLWHKGTPDENGRLSVTKNNIEFVMVVADDRITACEKQPTLVAS